MFEVVSRWVSERRNRTEAARETAERLIGRHGPEGAARLPASGLDPAVRRQLRKRLRTLKGAKGADRWPGP